MGNPHMAVEPWSLANIVSKVQDDLDAHDENLTDDIKQWVNDAIDDLEEIVIDLNQDFLLDYKDLTVAIGATEIDLPDDIYESRIRWLFFSENGYNQPENGEMYKLTKIKLEKIAEVGADDAYQYRLFNSATSGQKIFLFPPARETSTDKFRLWYIRQFKRLDDDADVLEKGLRIQYILSHVKCAGMQKLGDPMLDVENQKLLKQEDKVKKSLSRLTDDSEDDYLEPDDHALDEADYY
jgi:hypothetical protein